MKLIAEKIDGQYRCIVPDRGVLSFSELPHTILKTKSVPYQWSGYCSKIGGETEFSDYNFQKVRFNEKVCFMCSVENTVALMDYIDRYVLQGNSLFMELEDCLCGGMDYWFFLAWESAQLHFDEMPEWCQHIISLYIQRGYLLRAEIFTDQGEDEVFIFDKDDLKKCEEEILEIVRNELAECLEEKENEKSL